MRKVYIAAPIFNPQQLNVVKGITMTVRLLEYEYFSPYEASQRIWRGRAPKDCSQEERDQVLKGNVDNLEWADLLLAWVGGTNDGRTDTGVVWEMGHFNALQKVYEADRDATPKFTLAYISPTDVRQHMNLMLAGTVDAVAFGPAQLHKALSMLGGAEGYPAPDATTHDAVRERFSPNKHFLHEKEPIV